MILYDTHMHSSFSGDSEAAPIDMINRAKELSLKGICFTDHLDFDYLEEPGLFDLDVDDYFKKQTALARKESTDSFQILTGIEIGLMASTADKNKAVMDSFDFDFIIGSTHVVDGYDPYYESFWQGKDVKSTLVHYYETILENIKTCPYFDTVGHLDYIFRYAPIPKDSDTYTPYAEIVDAILQEIIRLDKALEINTGAYKKGLKEPNPSVKIIKRYKELGGKLITVGADAHEPKHIALGFEKLPELIKECGFNEVAVYKKRKPEIYGI